MVYALGQPVPSSGIHTATHLDHTDIPLWICTYWKWYTLAL